MKESEFIELLNLYLDHELSVADAGRLEAEVQNNPARRKVYQQYCRMQKACKVLAADFQSDVAREVADVEKKIIAFNPEAAAAAQRKRQNVMMTFGGLAAAACVAIILVNRADRNGAGMVAGESQQVVVQSTAPATSTGGAVATRVASESTGPYALGRIGAKTQHVKLVSDPLLLTEKSAAQDVVISTNEPDDQLKWIAKLQLSPLQPGATANDLRFDVQPVTFRPEARALGNNRAPAKEMTAFSITK
jgi:hypothetical protein